MSKLLLNGVEYQEYAFEDEEELEKAVIENGKFLFGPDSFYIDVKRRVGKAGSHNKGIPDGYLIDLSNLASPQLYFVENELEAHDPYSHVSEQIARFFTATKTSKPAIRDMLLQEIKKDKNLLVSIPLIN
jgi:hypothetical protein